MIPVDTNILLRLAQEGHVHQGVALRAIRALATEQRQHFVEVLGIPRQ